MAARTMYQIVGRYMDGAEVTGYHLQSMDTGKSGRYTREQVVYLVGRDQVTNCTGQIYQDKVLLRGNGMKLEDLPVQQEDGTMRNADKLGKSVKNNNANMMDKFTIIGNIKQGRNVIGYTIQNSGMATKKLKREQVIDLAGQGMITNARVQNYNGKVMLRGYQCDLNSLPSEYVDESGNTVPDKMDTKVDDKKTTTRSKEADTDTVLADCTKKILSMPGAQVSKNSVISLCNELHYIMKDTKVKIEETEISESVIDVDTCVYLQLKSGRSKALMTITVGEGNILNVMIEKFSSKGGMTLVDSKDIEMSDKKVAEGTRKRFITMSLNRVA